MKEITIEELNTRGYNYDGISNYKLLGICVKCNIKFKYRSVKNFLRSRKKHINRKEEWETCQKCWCNIIQYKNPEWIQKNREAQLIAQNKPEQKRKNAIAVSNSWDLNRKRQASELLKNRWKNDPNFAIKAASNIQWTQTNDAKYNEIMKKSLGTGGLKGEYNNLRYESALELSFILYCEEQSIKIKRYDLYGIKYIAEDNKERFYIPDFIISDNTIVEIKGSGLYHHKNYKRNICKLEALKRFTENNGMSYILLMETDDILKKQYKKARKLHHEIKKKNNY